MAPNLQPCPVVLVTQQVQDSRGFTEHTASITNVCDGIVDYRVRHSRLTPPFAHSVTTGWITVDGTVAHDHRSKHTIKGFDKISEDQRTRSLMRSGSSCEQSACVHHTCRATLARIHTVPWVGAGHIPAQSVAVATRCVASPFPLWSRASLPPFHCGGMVPFLTTCLMSSHSSSASLSPPAIQISLAISFGVRRSILATASGDRSSMLRSCNIRLHASRQWRPSLSPLACHQVVPQSAQPPRQAFVVVVAGQGSDLELYSRHWRLLEGSEPPGQFVELPRVAAVCRMLGIASNAFPLREPVTLQAVTFLGLSTLKPPLCDCGLPADREPTGAGSTLPLVGITVASGGTPSSIEGYSESHAVDIRSRITQVGMKTLSPLDVPPGIPRYPVFPRLILTFSETVDCSIGDVRSEGAAWRSDFQFIT